MYVAVLPGCVADAPGLDLGNVTKKDVSLLSDVDTCMERLKLLVMLIVLAY